jgi:hypothetical protein
MADDKKIIFSMVGVSKTFPPHKQVLKDIYLSFFYGAKIGIIGLNAGEIYLVKNHCRLDKEYRARWFPIKVFRGLSGTRPKTRSRQNGDRRGARRRATGNGFAERIRNINLKFGLPE